MSFIHYLEGISGIGIYPMFSLLVFFIFFVVLLFLVWKMNRSTIEELKQIPLQDQELASDHTTTQNH
ncbi:MAG: CcoQ/FixQ family Cbb3-type cytochrome c oxidase assembly chaperone [Chitinophagales bacterium]|nr:CcoQ/FixQ family Cbb3-type cytochrome c oxidase assembly chaperone [Chitinophagales bacterium]MCB9020612.1 CcoQ/FixQ family Cbb3-type cytochrome c oxidase assembly chaperone [Chitinophagales bacterium]MCB9031435.1 CcoQ/FixQ family Cbb3-type cytochrome c oxidase assembly chaperone [Chitinophagales bacterium]HPE98731.1 CcoQ/FixQ family Cbb3-type cytochrome c oxidase assembly chaperone [Chitinophagales bacterium]HPR29899.1 CcoQ/FixQ family Cbb3-type cytochrome c oxidase assembly chaperone [Chit